MSSIAWVLTIVLSAPELGSGDHTRHLSVDDRDRTCLVHVPATYDSRKPTPLVLILHGAGTNDLITVRFTGMNKKSDAAGFIAAYPNGTGIGPLQVWNAGGRPSTVDDVKFIRLLLDDLEKCLNIDTKRIFVTGMSNGGMMCYRLANEMSERIAAIAPVAGTLAVPDYQPKRGVPVMHFHGTEDTFVAFDSERRRSRKFVRVKTVPETMEAVIRANHCSSDAEVKEFPDTDQDGAKVTRKCYPPRDEREGAEVILFVVDKGGHTWPGQKPMAGFIGKSTLDISANDLMWEFFQKHPLKTEKK
ncbi:MAG: dienelactone hydrolase family protein [Planctomycetales bacterium]